MRYEKCLFILIMSIFLYGCVSSDAQFDKKRATQARLKLGLAYLNQMAFHPEYQVLAYQNLSLAQQYSPYDPEVVLGMAQFYQQVGEYEQAQTLYLTLMSEKVLSGPVFIYYGRFLCDIGQYDDAQDYFQQAIALKQYQWKIAAIEQSAYCALNQGEQVLAIQQFSVLFSLMPSKRRAAEIMREYYQSKNNFVQVSLLNSILE